MMACAALLTHAAESNWQTVRFPEVDKWVYYGPEAARTHMKDTQLPLLERLEAAVAEQDARMPR